MSAVRTSPLQIQVREAIGALGGYWWPANAAIRLLEELGELAEHALDPLLGSTALADECADLWIISTALADQFYGFVDEPQPLPAPPVDGPQQLAELVAAGGRIARIVNYYDGPKVPRTLDGWLTLEQATAALHGHLVAYCATQGVELRAAIDRTLARNVAQDIGRFEPSSDARTAPVLERYEAVQRLAGHPCPDEHRLFGAPEWIDGEWQASISVIARSLRTFLRAAPHEHLDGFVIGLPALEGRATIDIGDLWSALGVDHSSMDLHLFYADPPVPAPDDTPDDRFALIRSAN